MVTKVEQEQGQSPSQHHRNEKGTQLCDWVFIESYAESQRRHIIELFFVEVIFIDVEPLTFLFQLLLLFWAFVIPHVNVYLIGHDAVVSELYRLVEPKTVCHIFWFLQLELHDDLVKVQNVKLLLLIRLIGFFLNLVLN